LPDLTNQPADEVAAKIRQHGQLTPETTIDDVLMSCAVSQMTEDELRQIVAWLRTLRPR
jgi:hypothetical protein